MGIIHPMDTLRKLENRLENWVENSLARWWKLVPTLTDVKVAARRALEHSASPNAGCYTVRAHPQAVSALLADHPTLAELISADLVNIARQHGLTLTAVPEVRVVADDTLPPHRVQVGVSETSDLTSTQTLPAQPMAAAPALRHAYLMFPNPPANGTASWRLQGALIHLGRRPDNDVPIDHPLVSRVHAQLRLRHGRYVLYDLNSRQGTWVNGQRVREWVLHPGDVIRLGAVDIIYGEDSPTP